MRTIIAASLLAGILLADAARAEEPAVTFTAKPAVAVEAGGVRIDFAVSRATDVAVEVLDAKGETIRHLAAGVLGPNAPDPLANDSLKQSLLWDRKDDIGQAVPAGRCSVRVGLGLLPRLKRLENFDPLNFGATSGVVALPTGGLCVFGSGAYSDFLTRLIVVDRDGAYQRELFPPPAKLPPGASPGLTGFRRGDGRWVPLLAGTLPRPAGCWYAAMAAAGDHLYVCPFGAPAVYVIDLKTGGYLSPLASDGLGMGKGKIAIRSLAASPDGKWLYLTGVEAAGKEEKTWRPLHAVYRMPADGSDGPKVFFGDLGKADKPDTTLNNPVGLAADRVGNVGVCDNGNDRLLVITPAGKAQLDFHVDSPLLTQPQPAEAGGWFILCGAAPAGASPRLPASRARLRRFLSKGQPAGETELKLPSGLGKSPWVTGLAVHESETQATAWVALAADGWPSTLGSLFRFTSSEAGLTALPALSTNYRRYAQKGPYDPRYLYNWGVMDPSYQKYREAFDWQYLSDEGTPFYSFGPDANGLWADGRGYAWNDWIWYDKKAAPAFLRTAADKSPLPFQATGVNMLKPTHKPRAPWFAQRGVAVDRRGHVYMRYSWENAEAKAAGLEERNEWVTGILHFDATGKLVGEIALSHGTYGFGVDARGNIYVGDKPRPAGAMVPADLEQAFGGKTPDTIANWYGSVLKFAPTGGGFKFFKGAPPAGKKEERTRGDTFAPVPAGLDADPGSWSLHPHTADASGAQWLWVGLSPMVKQTGCICYGTNFAVDPHGRVFAPDKMACRVAVLDTNGNLIRTIGSYGNLDSRGAASSVPDPEIAFGLLRMVVSATSRQVRVADNGNNWLSVISLDYAADERAAVEIK